MAPHASFFETSLPVDVQLLIIDYLEGIDILNIQLTSKYFRSLIDDYAETIWRRCFWSLCANSKVYQPSFKEISCASEFKRACLKSYHFHELYLRATSANTALCPSREEITFVGGDPDEILHTCHFITGGRFLVSSAGFPTPMISLWELKEATATLVLRRPMDRTGYVSCVLSCPLRTRKLYLLYIGAIDETPAHITPPADDAPRLWTEHYEILEIDYHDATDSFSLLSVGILPIVTSGTDEVYLEDGYLIHLEGGVLVIWDFVNNRLATWRHPVLDLTQILFSREVIVLLNGEGVHGFKTPPLSPTCLQDGYLDLSSCAADFVAPTFTLSHDEAPSIPRQAKFLASCFPLERHVPVFYEVFAQSGDVHTTHRYRFVLTDNSESALGTLDRLQTTHISDPQSAEGPGITDLYSPWGSRLWTVWENKQQAGSALSLACSDPLDQLCRKHETLGGEPTENDAVLNPVHFMTRDVGVKSAACELDPMTGKAVAVCWMPEGRRWVELYTF